MDGALYSDIYGKFYKINSLGSGHSDNIWPDANSFLKVLLMKIS